MFTCQQRRPDEGSWREDRHRACRGERPRGVPPPEGMVSVRDQHPSSPMFPDNGSADRGADQSLSEARFPMPPNPCRGEPVQRAGRYAHQWRDSNRCFGTLERVKCGSIPDEGGTRKGLATGDEEGGGVRGHEHHSGRQVARPHQISADGLGRRTLPDRAVGAVSC